MSGGINITHNCFVCLCVVPHYHHHLVRCLCVVFFMVAKKTRRLWKLGSLPLVRLPVEAVSANITVRVYAVLAASWGHTYTCAVGSRYL